MSDLSHYYNYQFVQNETQIGVKVRDEFATLHKFDHGNLLAGTVVGAAYSGGVYIQNFQENFDGRAEPTMRFPNGLRLITVDVNHKEGTALLKWNKSPGDCHIVVSYEYTVDAPARRVSKSFQTPTFDKFFSYDEIMDIAGSAGTVTSWDFNSALGDTIMEKYESLYVKAVELNNVLMRKGAVGYFWIVTSPEVASIFETATAGFHPSPSEEFDRMAEYKAIDGVMPQGLPTMHYCGGVNRKWRLYKYSEVPTNMFLMGCNDQREDSSHYGRMMIANFII
jgi:hypothetical protein